MPEAVDALRAMVARGLTAREIAGVLGTTTQSVQCAMRRFGIDSPRFVDWGRVGEMLEQGCEADEVLAEINPDRDRARKSFWRHYGASFEAVQNRVLRSEVRRLRSQLS